MQIDGPSEQNNQRGPIPPFKTSLSSPLDKKVMGSFTQALMTIENHLQTNPNKRYLIGRVRKGANAGDFVVYEKGFKAWSDALNKKVDFKHLTSSQKTKTNGIAKLLTIINQTPTLLENQGIQNAINHLSKTIPNLCKSCKLRTNEGRHLMGEFYPPKAPNKSIFPNQKLSTDWVNAHEPKFQGVAQKLIENIDHVTHKEFVAELKNSVEDFNRYLDSQEDKSYIIVIPGDYKKSALWVTSLALDFLKHPPTKIVMLDDPNYDQILSDSNITKIAVFDDAAYSGAQMAEYMNSIVLQTKTTTICPIIPFMTNVAKARIRNKLEGLNTQYQISQHKIMPSFSNFLDDEEKKLLREEGGSAFRARAQNAINPSGFDNLTLTYFDHKKGDDLSLVPSIDTGCLLNKEEPAIAFVGKVSPPYKA
jgi:hypothetical protein